MKGPQILSVLRKDPEGKMTFAILVHHGPPRRESDDPGFPHGRWVLVFPEHPNHPVERLHNNLEMALHRARSVPTPKTERARR